LPTHPNTLSTGEKNDETAPSRIKAYPQSAKQPQGLFMNSQQKVVEELLALTDIEVNGARPWDIRVLNSSFYSRILRDPSMQMGETYMDGWWESDQLDETINKLLRAGLGYKLRKNRRLAWRIMMAKLFNFQARDKAFIVGEKHYDIGNDLYRAMLDPRMIYTCAYFRDTDDLAQAQEAKLDMVCKKLNLQKGQKILDIGCGWGGFLKYAAEKYGVEGVGVSVSQEQIAYGQEMCRDFPIELRLQDYRDIDEKFDHVVSLGMFEHVGYKNYRTYMEVVHGALKNEGCFLLHTIGLHFSVVKGGSWLNKYIFPGGMLPSVTQIGKASERLFIIEDMHNIGPNYDRTLLCWFENFDAHYPELKEKYDERFYRMWKYYLLSSAGNFRSRDAQVWQILFSKGRQLGGFEHCRRI
jgi:cyclopropane-fatty-acyl-phospholipid synthase